MHIHIYKNLNAHMAGTETQKAQRHGQDGGSSDSEQEEETQRVEG